MKLSLKNINKLFNFKNKNNNSIRPKQIATVLDYCKKLRLIKKITIKYTYYNNKK